MPEKPIYDRNADFAAFIGRVQKSTDRAILGLMDDDPTDQPEQEISQAWDQSSSLPGALAKDLDYIRRLANKFYRNPWVSYPAPDAIQPSEVLAAVRAMLPGQRAELSALLETGPVRHPFLWLPSGDGFTPPFYRNPDHD